MTRQEIKKVTDRELIVEYVKSYAHFDTNFVLRRGTDKLAKHLRDLEEELVNRDILTRSNIEELNR